MGRRLDWDVGWVSAASRRERRRDERKGAGWFNGDDSELSGREEWVCAYSISSSRSIFSRPCLTSASSRAAAATECRSEMAFRRTWESDERIRGD